MADVHFTFNAPDRLLAACHLADASYRAGERLAVYCRDKRRLHAFNRLLWEYARTAFVPHLPAADPLSAQTPVVLTDAAPGDGFAAVLNLDDDCVPPTPGVARILEVVSTDAGERTQARDRWRAYQAAGHALQRHDLSQAHA